MRKVARGDKQRTFDGYIKSNTSSPKVSTDVVIITTAIDAHKGHAVAIINIPGAFPNTKNDEFVLMLLQGKLAELMVWLHPKLYRKYVINSSRGELMLDVKLNIALYGMQKSALLFYKK